MKVKDVAIDTGASVVGAGVGLLILGPPGAFTGAATAPILADVLKRFLSKKEKTRIQKVAEIANKLIQKKINKGAKPTDNAKNPKVGELFEGTLLAAKDSYEEKKIPLFANLFATAPFTNTPINNMVQTLIMAEQLSYRELCIVSVIGWNEWNKLSKLTDKPLYSIKDRELPDENTQGIYEDINHLLVLGIIGQVFDKKAGVVAVASGSQFIAPANLILLYPGKLLFNGMQLDFVDKKDFTDIVDVLK